jgi:hypothetical protein
MIEYNVQEDAEGGVVEYEVPDAGSTVDEQEIQTLVGAMADEALLHREENLDAFLEEATKFYNAEKFGGEDKDRSQVVLPVVRNAIRQSMPSLLRVFFGPENVVEFGPHGADDIAIAEEQTEVINQIVIRQDNKGFLIFHDWFKDALARRFGAVKYWWERKTHEQTETFEDLTVTDITALASQFETEPGIEFEFDTEVTGSHPVTGEDLHKVRVFQLITDGRARFAVVPPEELAWSPSARSKTDSRLIMHVRDVPADELIAMGVDEEIVEEHRGDHRPVSSDSVEDARRYTTDSGKSTAHNSADTQDEATEPTQYAEIYARVDVDGDGIAELRLFKAVGIKFRVVNRDEDNLLGEPVNDIPFAILTPDPEPHQIIGLGQSDSTMPLQKIQSFVARGMLDSLAESIDPVKVADPRKANMLDVMSRKLSRVIRTRGGASPDEAVKPFVQPWVGKDALPVLEYLNHETEKSVGMPALSAGLEASSLQSSTLEGVRATVDGAQQQLEMVARIFAETGVRELFEGLLRLMVEHKDETRARIVKLRGEFVQPDLDRWDPTMDVRINVALGTGLVEQKIQTLTSIVQFQMELIQLGAPIVSWAEIRSTMAKVVELSGNPNADLFLKPFGQADQAAWEQQQQQNGQQGDPAMALAEVEREKAQLDHQVAQLKLALEQQKMAMEDDRERDKAAQEFALKSEELRIKAASEAAGHDTSQMSERLRAETEARRVELDADVKREAARASTQQNPQQGV